MELTDLIILALSAFLAGVVNAVAGGGTLITFPMLTALGVPAVVANVTNTIALSPGYLGGTWAQRKDLAGQGRLLWILLPVSLLGGICGGFLLLNTGEKNFRALVPWLILFASLLLAVQPYIRKWIASAGKNNGLQISAWWLIFFTLPAAVYGGYFGAGVSVIIVAVLGVVLHDSITRLNALKQAMAFVINVSTAVFFVFSATFSWSIAIVMAAGAILGGLAGGRLAAFIRPAILRWTIVVIGMVVSIIYFIK